MRALTRIASALALLGLLGCGKAADRPQPEPAQRTPQASAELLGDYRLELGRPSARRSETSRWCYLTLDATGGALTVEPWHPGPDHTFTCQQVKVSPSGLVSLVVHRAQAYAERRPDLNQGELVGSEVFVPEETWELSLRMQRDPQGAVASLEGDALVRVALEGGGQSRFKQRFRAVRVDEDELAAAERAWDESLPPTAPDAPRSVAAVHGQRRRVSPASARDRAAEAAEAAQRQQLARAAPQAPAEKATITETLTPAAIAPAAPAPVAVADAAATPVPPAESRVPLYALLGLIGLPLVVGVIRARRRPAPRRPRIVVGPSVPPTRRQPAPAGTRRARASRQEKRAARRKPPTRAAHRESSERLAVERATAALSRPAPQPEPSDPLWFKPGALQVHAVGESSEDLLAPDDFATPAPPPEPAADESHLRLMIEDAWASESAVDVDEAPAPAALLDDPPEYDAPDWDADAANTIRDWGSESSGEFPAYTGDGSSPSESSTALMAPPEPKPRPRPRRRRLGSSSQRLRNQRDA